MDSQKSTNTGKKRRSSALSFDISVNASSFDIRANASCTSDRERGIKAWQGYFVTKTASNPTIGCHRNYPRFARSAAISPKDEAK